MDQFNKWRNDSDAASTYSGPNTATPYFDTNKFYNDNLKNVKSQIAQTITRPDGTQMYYMKNTNELIDEGRLQQIVNDLTFSDPRASQQSQINAWFTAKGKTPEMIVGSLNDETNYTINSTKGTIQYLKDQIQTNPNDPKLKSNYTSQIKSLESYVQNLEKNKLDYTVDKYNQNPDYYNFVDYQNRTARAFGNIYKVNKQTLDFKPDTNWYLQEKLKIEKERTDMMGLKYGLTKVNGQWVMQNPNGTVPLGGIFSPANVKGKDYTLDPDGLNNSETDIRQKTASLNTEEAQVSVQTIQQAIQENPNLEGVFTKELQDELTRRGMNANKDDKQFDFDDLRFIKEMEKEGTLSKYLKVSDNRPYPSRVNEKGEPTLTEPYSTGQSVNKEGVKFASTILNKMYDIWKNNASVDAPVDGVNFKDLGLLPAFNSIQTMRRKKDLFNNTLKTSFSKAGLTEQEQNDYMDYLENPGKYQIKTSEQVAIGGADVVSSETVEDNDYMKGIKSKLKSSTYLKDISVRLQPVGWAMLDESNLSEKNIAGKNTITSIKRQISNNITNGYYAGPGENVFKITNKEGVSITDSDVSDVVIYKTDDMIQQGQSTIPGFETNYYASAIVKVPKENGKGFELMSVNVPIDKSAIHQTVGDAFELPTEQQLTNEEVRRFGSTSVTYGGNINNFRVDMRVVSTGENNNSLYPRAKVQLVVSDPNSRTGKSYISIFGDKQPWNTPAEAERRGRELVDFFLKENKDKKITLQDLVNQIQNKSNAE